jgi:hypothetical protein
MKKVILSLVFVAVLTVVSCKEKDAEVTEDASMEVVEEATPVVEEAATVVDSAAVEAPAETPAQ